jgi:hypothetical protein
MAKQLSLLPLMHQFDKYGFMTDTTYYETDACEEGDCYLVFNIDYYTLLIPEGKSDWLSKVVEAETVVITNGSYNGIDDYFEIMFMENIETQEKIMIPGEQFERVSPLKEGWHGHLYIYVGGLYNCKLDFDKVYFRVADTLPFCKPVGE